LRARLRAGERILSMQQQLVEKNRLVGSTLNELQKVYDLLDRDLLEAKKLQQTLVRDRWRDFGGGTAALLIRPSGHVGGDLAGWFRINDQRIGLYSVDVAGHGVASAMMTARLAGLLSGESPDQNVALMVNADGRRDAWPPEQVAERLNRMMIEDMQVDQYFTLAYADVDLTTGQVAMVQAGHPHPTAVRGGLYAESLGEGGLPIGLIPGATYDRIATRLMPGDRLFLASDGITECPDANDVEFGGEGLERFLTDHATLALPDLLEALIWRLADFRGSADFPDDVSGLVFDFTGQSQS
jgi:phosphoserine phosphatase RsbU/P